MNKIIMDMIKNGLSNKEICTKLNISSPLVSYYKKKNRMVRNRKNENQKGKRQERLERTGLSKEQLTSAVTKFLRKRQNASKTRHEFTLTFDEILWNKFCPILGIELDYFANKIQHNSVSFDRVDSTKGYIPGNIQIISHRANNLKGDGTLREFELLVKYLKKSMVS